MKHTSKIALVDCNNFFASCERVFQPHLRGKPVVILSNNDGCVIARSNEAKALGIPMGAPFFKCKEIIEAHDIRVFSSNFRLYGDMSRRVMGILQQMVSNTEVYSVDEAFVHFDEKLSVVSDLYGYYMKNTVYQYTGIPVSVGIATSKVLAKLATWIVKEDHKKSTPQYNGVFDFTQLSEVEQDEILKKVPIGEVWGVGRKLRSKYTIKGFPTAYHLKYSDLAVVRKYFHVFGERLRQELNGIPSLSIENTPTQKKSIISSRSFGKAITKKSQLREALATYIATAATKLLKEDLLVQDMKIYIRSGYHKITGKLITRSEYILLPSPTNHIPTLIKAMSEALDEIYLPDIAYKKAGVMFGNLTKSHPHQTSLFPQVSEQQKNNDTSVTYVYHQLRHKHGKQKLLYASEGVKKSWMTRSDLRSKEFTTKWSDVMVVR